MKNSQKGSTIVVLLVIIVVILVGVISWIYFKQSTQVNRIPDQSQAVNEQGTTSISSSTQSAQVSWQSYSDNSWNFSFQYPSSWGKVEAASGGLRLSKKPFFINGYKDGGFPEKNLGKVNVGGIMATIVESNSQNGTVIDVPLSNGQIFEVGYAASIKNDPDLKQVLASFKFAK